MFVKKAAAIVLTLCLFTLSSASEATAGGPTASVGPLQFTLDTAGFRLTNGATCQEVYVLIDTKQLRFLPHSDRYLAKMRMTLTVVDASVDTVHHSVWGRDVAITDRENMLSLPLKEIATVNLPSGPYGLSFKIEDFNSGMRGKAVCLVEVKDFAGQELQISDLLLASDLERSEEKDRFDKFGWRAEPSVQRQYQVGDPLSVYFEVYNVTPGEEDSRNAFFLGYRLTDVQGNVIRKFQDRRVITPGRSAAKADELETTGLIGGDYFLEVEILDRQSKQYLSTKRHQVQRRWERRAGVVHPLFGALSRIPHGDGFG
jgi:hypothetical protein